MKKIGALGLAWLLGVTAVRAAEEAFSKAVSAEYFSAAGLAKLSREELARLDGLVGAYRSGALVAARRDAAEAPAVAEARVARAEAANGQRAEGGVVAKAKVMLTPGTEVEYAAVESRIAGDFTGWEGRAVLTLENGQRWQIANGGLYSTPPLKNPRVKIVPAPLGGFWLTIEGVATRVRVVPFGAK